MILTPPLLVLLNVGHAQSSDPCGAPGDRDYASHVPVAAPGMGGVTFPLDFTMPECPPLGGGPEFCAPYVALVPNGTLAQGELFLLLPGQGMEPEEMEHIAYMAAYAGHPTLVVPWNTDSAAGFRCLTYDAGGTSLLGGACTDECNRVVREEWYNGVDDPLTGPEGLHTVQDTNGNPVPNPDDPTGVTDLTFLAGHEAQYLTSVRQRIGRGLNQLAAGDTNGDWDWDLYCAPHDTYGTEIQWASVVVGGFSMGASMAQYIGHQKDTAGVFSAEGFGDYCDVDFDGVNGTTAPWVSSSPATSISGWRATYNELSTQFTIVSLPKVGGIPKQWDELGLEDNGTVYLEEVADTGDTGNPGIPDPFHWQGSQLMRTDHTDGTTSAHSTMGNDADMLNQALSGSIPIAGAGSSGLYLFDAYLGAMCEL